MKHTLTLLTAPLLAPVAALPAAPMINRTFNVRQTVIGASHL